MAAIVMAVGIYINNVSTSLLCETIDWRKQEKEGYALATGRLPGLANMAKNHANWVTVVSFRMGNVKKAISVQRNLHNNLVYIINLIIFAMQSGTAMPLSDLSAGGTTGMSEQYKSFNIQENSRNHGRNNKHDCRAQSGNHPRIDRTQPAHNQQEFCTAINLVGRLCSSLFIAHCLFVEQSRWACVEFLMGSVVAGRLRRQ